MIPASSDDVTLPWLNQVFKPHGITVYNFKFVGETGQGRGWMGSLNQAELEISRSPNNNGNPSGQETELLHVVFKTLPECPVRKSYTVQDGFSAREVSFYTQIFKAWREFLDDCEVPESQRFQPPLCYYGGEEGEGDSYRYLLVLENLVRPGSPYANWNGGFNDPLPWAVVAPTIRQLARMHATGLAFKHTKGVPSYQEAFPKLVHVTSQLFNLYYEKGFEVAHEVIKGAMLAEEIPDGLFEQLEVLKKPENRDLILEWFHNPDELIGEIATVCHNDMHSNNMVVAKDQSSTILFDYQGCCVFNPMKDLSFFLILNCSFADSTTNVDRALKLYHDEFATTMSATNTSFKYDLSAITKDYEKFLGFSIVHVLTGAPIWITGESSTEESRRRFAMVVIDAFKRGLFTFPSRN